MFIVKENLEKIKKRLNLDRISYIAIALLLVIIAWQAKRLCAQPINQTQYQYVVVLATQAEFPHTQRAARDLLLKGQMNRIHYLKLLRAQQFEAARVRQQPAMQLEQNYPHNVQQGS